MIGTNIKKIMRIFSVWKCAEGENNLNSILQTALKAYTYQIKILPSQMYENRLTYQNISHSKKIGRFYFESTF